MGPFAHLPYLLTTCCRASSFTSKLSRLPEIEGGFKALSPLNAAWIEAALSWPAVDERVWKWV